MSSSQKILLAFAVLVLLVGLLYQVRVLGVLAAWTSQVVRLALRLGFGLWRRWLAQLSWPALLGLIFGFHLLVWLTGGLSAVIYLLTGAALLLFGVTSCVAYIVIDQERYEVARGYKVLHNPGKGQELAFNLLHFGPSVGLPLLVSACLASVSGFALLNLGLYESVARNWYFLGRQGHHVHLSDGASPSPDVEKPEPTYDDFLVWSVLNLASAFDLIDVINQSHWDRLSYIHANRWPASMMQTLFRLFFTLVLLRQLFAWFRDLRLLHESIRDFWSPHEPIHRRAGQNLSQQGLRAVEYLLRSMVSVEFLTPEQRAYLPEIFAMIGPAAVPLLVRRLDHPQEPIREVVVAALGRLHAGDALLALVRTTEDDSERVRQALAEALGDIFAPGVAAVRKRWNLRRHFFREHAGRRPLPGQGPRPEKLPPIDPAEVAVGALRRLAVDPARGVRGAAVRALTALGAAAAPALPELTRLIEDEDLAVRQLVADALGTIQEEPEDRVAALIHLLDDPIPSVRLAALQAIGSCGEEAFAAVPALLSLLQDSEESIREAAAVALSQIGTLGPQATPRLVAGLRSRDNLVRARAAEGIGLIGEAAASTVPALLEALRDPNDRVRGRAAWALGRLGAAAKVAVPALVAALADQDFRVSAQAAEALGALGPAAGLAEPALLRALHHINPEVRKEAAAALAQLGLPTEQVAPALTALAGDADPGVRLRVLEVLGTLSGRAPKAWAALHGALADPDPAFRITAIRSLAHIHLQVQLGSPDLAATLLPLLADRNEEVKKEAAQALGRVGEAPAEVLAGLGQLLRDEAEGAQLAAAQALGQLGPDAAAAGADLQFAMQRGTSAVREQVMRAMAQVMPPEAPATFLAGLSDLDPGVRLLASAGLVRVAPLPADALPALVEALKDSDPRLRGNLALVLGKQPEVPDAAVPLLLACVDQPDDGLRLNALRALRGHVAQLAAVLPPLLGDPNPQVALRAAAYLLLLDATQPEADALIEKALAGPPRDRRQAVEVLEELGDRAARFEGRIKEQSEAEEDAELRERLGALLSRLAATPAS